MKIKLISTLVLASLLLSPVASSQEEEKQDAAERFKLGFKQKLRFFFEVGAQGGGDSTAPLPLFVRQTNGYVQGIDLSVVGAWQGLPSNLDPVFSDSVEAGGLYKLAFGAEIPLSGDFTLMTSLGTQFDEVYGDLLDGSGGEGSFSYSRTTVELIPFYNMGRHRVGLGAELHLSPKGRFKESAVNQFRHVSTYTFDDAEGIVLRYDYLINKNLSMGVKLTQMTYDFESVSTYYAVGGNAVVDQTLPCISNCEEIVTADSFGIHLSYRF
ncbi:hypothetical protein FLL45_02755 [Aliikangiella marina]|uniref:MipA/OmpV family protein n=1 Tax=Aliikangiella marina TaxID=1712262 RepID=A0A545TI33_9GAMM|nr:hypothetical protein [Aliikangiella marina]TQV76890.1 hypothetical protein FLL45_02755 [Aliikangiella marina]